MKKHKNLNPRTISPFRNKSWYEKIGLNPPRKPVRRQTELRDAAYGIILRRALAENTSRAVAIERICLEWEAAHKHDSLFT